MTAAVLDDVAVPEDQHAARVAAAWTLRAQGKPYRDIARQLDISPSTAHLWVRQAASAAEFAGLPDRNAERRRDAATLDRWLSRCEDAAAEDGMPVAPLARAVVELLRRRAALLGLDQPVRVAVAPDRAHADPDPDLVVAVSDEVRALQERERSRAMDPARDGED